MFLFLFIKTGCWLPDIVIGETDDSCVVMVDLPGLETKDIKIRLNQRSNLVIKGERDVKISKKGKGYTCFEKSRRNFFIEITFPIVIKAQFVEAKYCNGLLELNITKPKENAI